MNMYIQRPEERYLVLDEYTVESVDIHLGVVKHFTFFWTAIVVLNPLEGHPSLKRIPTSLLQHGGFNITFDVANYIDHIIEAITHHHTDFIAPYNAQQTDWRGGFDATYQDNYARYLTALEYLDKQLYRKAQSIEKRVDAISLLKQKLTSLKNCITNIRTETVFPKTWALYNHLIHIEAIARFYTLNVRRIQRTWRLCVSDPKHEICRRRLLWEYQDITS